MNILIIEDHKLLVNSYINILEKCFPSVIRRIEVKSTLDQVNHFIYTEKEVFDIILLDCMLPGQVSDELGGTISILPKFKQKFPNCRIIAITAYTDAITIYEISKSPLLNGVLIKSDVNATDIEIALKVIERGGKIQSQTVKDSIQKISNERYYLDNYNRQILFLLSRGVKTKELPNFLPLSISSIDKRKACLRDFFSIGKSSDETLITEVRRLGIV